MEMWFVNDRNVKITKMKLIICVFVKSLVECFCPRARSAKYVCKSVSVWSRDAMNREHTCVNAKEKECCDYDITLELWKYSLHEEYVRLRMNNGNVDTRHGIDGVMLNRQNARCTVKEIHGIDGVLW